MRYGSVDERGLVTGPAVEVVCSAGVAVYHYQCYEHFRNRRMLHVILEPSNR